MNAKSIDFLINRFLPLYLPNRPFYDNLLLQRMNWLFVRRRGDVTVSDEVHEPGGGIWKLQCITAFFNQVK